MSGPGRSRLVKQAETLLDESTDALDLVAEIDFGYIEHNDEYTDWHSSTPLSPMVRALFLKELEDYSYSELHRYLTENTVDAAAIGFDDIPARSTFGRTWRDRFDDDLQHYLTHGAREVRKLARERGNTLGLHGLEPKDKSGASRRTKDRFINKKIREVTEEMQRLVFPVFDFDRADNAHYDSEAFLELQSHMGLSQSAAESGSDLFNDNTDRPEGGPNADTHLYNIKQLSESQVQRLVDTAIGRMATEAKRHLEFNRPADAAIDMTYVAYYGERDELEMITGTPDSKAYDWCYKFATLTVVGENVKLTLAMTPVRPGYVTGDIVRELIWQAQDHVNLHTVYADSEFCTVDTIRALDEAGIDYVIPGRKNKRVKREIDRMAKDVKVITDYTMYGLVSGGSTKTPESTNLILLPSTKDESVTVPFITSKDVSDDLPIDREDAKGWVNRYSRRWGIENSYKTIKDFLAWTTSKEFVVRLFYFGFAVLLYNMWLLVDLLVQVSLDVEHRYKPRVTAKRFLNLARKQLATG